MLFTLRVTTLALDTNHNAVHNNSHSVSLLAFWPIFFNPLNQLLSLSLLILFSLSVFFFIRSSCPGVLLLFNWSIDSLNREWNNSLGYLYLVVFYVGFNQMESIYNSTWHQYSHPDKCVGTTELLSTTFMLCKQLIQYFGHCSIVCTWTLASLVHFCHELIQNEFFKSLSCSHFFPLWSHHRRLAKKS